MDIEILTTNQNDAEKPAPRKMGVVAGARDRSEVESMIQRYLELAHSALKEETESGKKGTRSE